MNNLKKNLIKFLLVICIISIAISLSYIIIVKQQQEEERENQVWLARCELETLRYDKEVQYLRLYSINYENNLLKLIFNTSLSTDEIKEAFQDSLMHNDFMSVVVLNPKKWETICEHLSNANVDLSITYSSHIETSFTISAKQLSQMISDDFVFNEGLDLFVKRKKQEVLSYARYHFKKDRYLRVDSFAINNDYVSLHLSYDDNKANLSSTFLDTSKVALHYTDKVGDMGSILNNMLSICARTNKGFEFVYTGKKSRRVQRCKYDASRAKKIYEETADKIWLDKRKTNQVSTIIYKTK